MARRIVGLFAAVLVVLAVGSSASAQVNFLKGGLGNPLGGVGDNTEKVTVSAHVEPIRGTNRATLVVTAKMAPEWHIYSITQEPDGPTRSKLKLDPSDEYRQLGPFETTTPPEVHRYDDIWKGLPVEEHAGEAVWKAPIELANGVDPTKVVIRGALYAQVCSTSCLPPRDYIFSTVGLAAVPPGPRAVNAPPGNRITQQAGMPAAVPAGAYDVEEFNNARVYSLSTILAFAFLGGLILNLMPCVLPVIGLKVLSFVEQGGHSHARIMMLNLMYSVGMLAVFMVLATLAVTLNLGWGQHFGSVTFNITLCALVFAMALSFLGVWEIPIPGFVGSGAAVQAASREGLAGAFVKGAITTVLATPCSGPYLGTVFGFTVNQSPEIIFLVFAAVGVGMASPYLVIGAFPQLVRLLPKPGAWMETFKQLMGFVLLGTVVFLFTFLDSDYLVPTFALLIGIWAGCWWIGRTPLTVSSGRRLLAWLEGAAAAAVVGSIAFTWLVPQDHVLRWEAFSRARLEQLNAEGKTVLVDFTANWCATCKWNMKNAIDTDAVGQLVDANGVVPMLADWSTGDETIHEMITALRGNSIPLLAVFPANKKGTAIVLRDLISEGQLLRALEKAGPSRASTMARQPDEKPAPAKLDVSRR